MPAPVKASFSLKVQFVSVAEEVLVLYIAPPLSLAVFLIKVQFVSVVAEL